MTSTETCYTKIDGQYQPINVTAAGIKCVVCSNIFPSDKLEDHLRSHVKPNYQKPAPKAANTPSKLNLASLDMDSSDQSFGWVTSFNPQELPTTEQVRREANRPTGQVSQIRVNEMLAGTKTVPDRNNDHTTAISTDEGVEFQEELDLCENIPLGKISEKVTNKEIHVYRSENLGSSALDGRRIPSKIRPALSDDQDTQQGYDIEPDTRVYESLRSSADPAPHKNVNQQRYEIKTNKKIPLSAIKISTHSTPIPSKSEKPEQGRSQMDKTARHHPLECPCCKGFYCDHCKSNVPPIFRPIPDENGNYHFHPSSNYNEAVEFYRDHYYAGQRVCTDCDRFGQPTNQYSNMKSTIGKKRLDESQRTDIYESRYSAQKNWLTPKK